jgi:hypothetical protein
MSEKSINIAEQFKQIADIDSQEFKDLFSNATLTMKDRIPTNILLLYTILSINKAIREIKYTDAELREAILCLIAMIPDEMRDPEFKKEMETATQKISVDIRPDNCGEKASYETCERLGIPHTQIFEQQDYFAMYHAVFNLLMRNHMLLRTQDKEVQTFTNPE